MRKFDRIVTVTMVDDLKVLERRYSNIRNVRSYLSAAPAAAAYSMQLDSASVTVGGSNKLAAKGAQKFVKGGSLEYQSIESTQIAGFQWLPNDLVVLIGGDGLLPNVAQYLKENQVVICVNQNASESTGVIAKHRPDQVETIIDSVLKGSAKIRPITMGNVSITLGNSTEPLTAINEFFIGRNDQKSARYTIEYNGSSERQSSSGVIVSTGMGSTGWLKSCLGQVNNLYGNWSAKWLHFYVREPFASISTFDHIKTGAVDIGKHDLTIYSEMPEKGVIFSDGMMDYPREFTSGAVARFSIAPFHIDYVD